MFCYCLIKNWKGIKDLIVCITHSDKKQIFKDIADDIFDDSWKIEIKDSIQAYPSGTTEQQVNAVFYSIKSGAEEIVVWDCKDFLLKPCDLSIFKKDDKHHRVTYICTDQKLIDMGYDLSGLLDTPIDHFPAIINLRPWIWNVAQLERYWNHMNSRFGDFLSWKEYPTGSEIYGYYLYTLNDQDSRVKFLPSDETPLILGGGWTHQTYEGMLQEEKDFSIWPERVVWKHSRKIDDPRCLDITRNVLLKYGIEKEIINRVFGS
jgi:hypothetical protein